MPVAKKSTKKVMKYVSTSRKRELQANQRGLGSAENRYTFKILYLTFPLLLPRRPPLRNQNHQEERPNIPLRTSKSHLGWQGHASKLLRGALPSRWQCFCRLPERINQKPPPVGTTMQSSLAYRAHLHVGHVPVSRRGVEKNGTS